MFLLDLNRCYVMPVQLHTLLPQLEREGLNNGLLLTVVPHKYWLVATDETYHPSPLWFARNITCLVYNNDNKMGGKELHREMPQHREGI